MRILFLGDIVGRSGRDAVIAEVPRLRKRYALDCIIANGENATHGFGLSAKHFQVLIEAGIDIITLGNHAWDQMDILSTVDTSSKLIRPHNYPCHHPGTGISIIDCGEHRRVMVVQISGILGMMAGVKCPFETLDEVLPKNFESSHIDAIVVDIHAEFTAEKNALGFFVDGRASLVAGTHTHIPTADHRILPGGTAFITDVGMCGDYQSVIGFDPQASIKRQQHYIPKPRLMLTKGPATVCGVLIETDPKSIHATSITPIRIGGSLETAPLHNQQNYKTESTKK